MNMDELREVRLRIYRDQEGNFRLYVLGVDWLDCVAFDHDVVIGEGSMEALQELVDAASGATAPKWMN